MQNVCLFYNARIHTNSATALIEAPYHMRFVIQHVRELWCMSFLVLLFSPVIGVIRKRRIGKEIRTYISNRIRTNLRVNSEAQSIHSNFTS